MNQQPPRRSVLHTLLSALIRKAPEEAKQHVQLSQHPTPDDRDAWRAYWEERGQPWRTEPEIDEKRQEYLAQRRITPPDIEHGTYPFKDVKLNRADIEWLLATHENGRGPVIWSDERQRDRAGLDLRGADLSGSEEHPLHLSGLPLSRLRGGLTALEWDNATEDQRGAAAVCMERTKLWATALWGATLNGAQLAKADLTETQLEGSGLLRAQLQDATLLRANLKRALLIEAHLERTDLRGVWLAEAWLNGATLGDEKHQGPQLADTHWSNVNLTVVNWSQVTMLGDEYEACQKKRNGTAKDRRTRLQQYQTAVRANRQLALALQSQGLSEDAARFAYRAQVLQRKVFWFEMVQGGVKVRQRVQPLGAWLFSWFLFLLAGYGYKPGRSFFAYLLVIGTFMALYLLLDPHLLWYEAIVLSMTAFHGRGFSPTTFTPGDPLSIASAVEAFVGLIIEVTFIATLTRRFFGQ